MDDVERAERLGELAMEGLMFFLRKNGKIPTLSPGQLLGLKKKFGKAASKVVEKNLKSGVFKVKKRGLSGKEGAKDPPDFAKQFRPFVGESGKEFAKRVLETVRGPIKHKTGPDSDFNKIQKWADRSFEDPRPRK